MMSVNYCRLLVLGLTVFGLIAQVVSADQRNPLLMAGKKTMYQRVLTRPGARLSSEAGNYQGIVKPAFTRYYVYARKEIAGTEWLEVGPDSRGNISGWMQSQGGVPWKQQISLVFSNPAGRERVLMFKDRKSLEDILTTEAPADKAAAIRKTLKSGAKDLRIVSIEPEIPADIDKNFYLLPILQADKIYSGTSKVTLLEIASVSQMDTKATGETGAVNGNQNQKAALLREFKAGVVFVIDSTISMGTYIDRIKKAVRRIYSKIEEKGMLDKVKFGLIAYRSSVKAVPELEYVTKKYVDPSEVKDGKDFLEKVDTLKPATVSSIGFNEDTYSGVMAAMTSIKWTDFGARYVILITDAGAIESRNELSGTGLGAEQVQQEAKHRGVAIYTLHLKTPQGVKNHQQAETQYKTLSMFKHPSLEKPLYYPVDLGSVGAFGKTVDSLSDSIVAVVNDAYRGKRVVGSAQLAAADFGHDKTPVSQAVQVQQDTKLISHAMQLAYLGRETGTQVPSVINAWVSDSAIEDPGVKSIEVRVLLTKNQLSDTQLVVESIVDAMRNGMINPNDFFKQLRMAAVKIRADANQLKKSGNTKLADLGLLGEYLDDLPYRREILDLDEDTWKSYAAQQQEAEIIKLERKLKYYKHCNADADRWISLAEGSDPGDHVYPIPIEMLP